MKNRNLNHSDHWETPKELYDKLNSEFNFDFDPCLSHSDVVCFNAERGLRDKKNHNKGGSGILSRNDGLSYALTKTHANHLVQLMLTNRFVDKAQTRKTKATR